MKKNTTENEGNNSKPSVSAPSGGGGGGDVMGGVTKAWVNQNFVSIEFFGRLFETYDSATPTPTQVLPNDLESTITNIKAKFGLWTEQYLSALGQGTGGGGGGALPWAAPTGGAAPF